MFTIATSPVGSGAPTISAEESDKEKEEGDAMFGSKNVSTKTTKNMFLVP